MPNVPTLVKLDLEQVPEEHRKWMAPIVEALNRFLLESVQWAQAQKNPTVRTLRIDPRSSFPFTVPWSGSLAPTDVHVARVRSDDPSAPIGSLSVDWEMTSGGGVRIVGVTGLTAGFIYTVDLSLTP